MESVCCILMRGGTSKGPFFKVSDLPQNEEKRNQVLLDIMGSPHHMQIDGIGGGQNQTSKVAIVEKSRRVGVDIDYLFAQVLVDKAIVDTAPNCGNIITAVAPFAIETGMIKSTEEKTTVKIFNVNTSTTVEAEVETKRGKVIYDGNFKMDGVPGSGSPIYLRFANAEGAKTGKLLPTGKAREKIKGVFVSLVDYSMPMMMMHMESVGFNGTESITEINSSKKQLAQIENMRLEAGKRMGLGDVSNLVIPKVGLLSAAKNGGTLTDIYLTPHSCHKSHAITGGMCVAASCYIKDSIASEIIGETISKSRQIVIEHPSGNLQLEVMLNEDSQKIKSIATIRTARKLFAGKVFYKHRLS